VHRQHDTAATLRPTRAAADAADADGVTMHANGIGHALTAAAVDGSSPLHTRSSGGVSASAS
jgi:hypothetical protein